MSTAATIEKFRIDTADDLAEVIAYYKPHVLTVRDGYGRYLGRCDIEEELLSDGSSAYNLVLMQSVAAERSGRWRLKTIRERMANK